MKKLSLNILLFISVSGFCQVSLQGIIRLDSSDIKISKVIVSITELNFVTQCDESGFYQLKNIPKGRFTIMYKLFGYQSQIFSMNLKDTLVEKNVWLKQSFLQYPEVVAI